jgi:tripartite ATP-independent transporter DctP family solute receptor
MLKQSSTHVLGLLLGVGLLAGTVQAAEWKFAIEEISGSVQDRYAQEFKRLIEEKSEGAITVEVYPYGSLGTSSQLTELVQIGAIQLANASPGHLGSLVPEIQVFSIPYLLSQNNEVNKQVLTESEIIYGTIADSLEQRDLRLLTMYPEGDMVWTANKAIRTPEDLDNFRMRTMVSPILVEAYEAFGASPTPMPYGEVYGGLQLGSIDGQVNPIFAIEEMKFYEVQDYMIWAGQQQFTTTVVSGNDWYHSMLSDEERAMLDETIDELADFIFEVQDEYNQERLDKILEDKPGMQLVELTEEERAVFRERSMAVRDKFVDMVGESGRAVLDGLLAEFEAAEAELGG